jgi:precorrin-2 dehydrogenase/sirohydrochlorin ferrochelatase
MGYYPVLLDLQGRRCIVVGGGPVAEGKVKALLEAEAEITVISPEVTEALQALADEGKIALLVRRYRPGDLAGAFLVVCATDDRGTHELVWQEAMACGILINVVDDPSRCTFIAPAVMRRGDLVVAISTSGKAPALAVRLRERLEKAFGDEYACFLELVGALRAPLAARWPNFEQRKALWYQLVDSDVLDLLRQGREMEARQRIKEITGISLRKCLRSPD